MTKERIGIIKETTMAAIYFRTDGNHKIATGHLMRCLAIARACAQKGACVKFIVSDSESLTLLKERFKVPQEFGIHCLNRDQIMSGNSRPSLLPGSRQMHQEGCRCRQGQTMAVHRFLLCRHSLF